MKRGELSMEVIIIAAIALLVLVILSVLIIRAATNTSEGTGCMAVPGATCDYSDCSDAGPNYARGFKACPADAGGVCCIPAG